MVSELDSFLQFIAAICFTITIDSSVFQSFWNADYYGIVDNCIKRYKVITSTPKDNELKDFVYNHKRTIEAKGRMQGAYLLLVSCVLIIYGLFESMFVVYENVHDLALSVVLFITFLVVVFTNCLSKWGKVLLWWGITIAVLLIFTFLSCKYGAVISDCVDLMVCQIILRTLLVISIGIPVGFRFLYNWLYTNRYPIFLDASLAQERSEYEKAKKAIKERRKDELPQKYEKAFSYAFMDKDKSASNEEDIVANCTDIYYEQIERIISNQPSICRLLKKVQYASQTQEAKITEPIPSIAKESIENKMQKLIKEYNSLTPKPKMKDYCSQKNVALEDFKYYRNKQANGQ